MQFSEYSYRFAREILQHESHQGAWNEIVEVLAEAPLFLYPGKSRAKPDLDVVQQVTNTYFERRLAVDFGWDYHPLATMIQDSGLAADFRKGYGDLTIQAEVQFGNMARWYSDIFKFQTAYSQNLINLGLSILPVFDLAKRIDQNVANFERAVRELPSAKLSITLPILLIGLYPGAQTKVVDLRECRFKSRALITGNTNRAKENRWRIVHAYLSGVPMATVGPDCTTGPMPSGNNEDETA
ncbi:MAG: BglII/BstYI family type II restriction endonuclease [Chloroflexota bacterium]